MGLVAFSNYILHMLICTTKCYGYGFGLSGRVARTGQIEIVVVIWILQLLMPPAWSVFRPTVEAFGSPIPWIQ